MTRALVLSGGGPVGIAWEAGLIAGLAEGGAHLAKADYILGTSAGSFVGSQLAMGRNPVDMAAAIIAEADRAQAASRISSAQTPRPTGGGGMTRLMELMAAARSGKRDPTEVRREIGAYALETATVDEETFIKSFGRQLADAQADAWPKGNFACTAVDALTGEFVIWNADSKVGLARAVASSCSVPGVYPPITINGRRYIDGGMRSGSNADLAKGHELVVILALRTAAATPEMRAPLEREIEALQAGGAKVEVLYPDEASVAAFGANMMNASVRPAAAKAGLEQGRAIAGVVGGYWK